MTRISGQRTWTRPTGARRDVLLRRLLVALVVILVGLPALHVGTASALVLPLDLDQLTVRAGLVVRARVLSTASRWQASAKVPQGEGKARGRAAPSAPGAAIVTDVRLRVEDLVKVPFRGSVGGLSLLATDPWGALSWTGGPFRDLLAGGTEKTVTITVPGGSIGGWHVQVEDAAAFLRGSEYLVFLDAAGRVVGWSQGTAPIVDGWVPAFGRSLADVETRITEIGRKAERLRQRLVLPLASVSFAQAGGFLGRGEGASASPSGQARPGELLAGLVDVAGVLGQRLGALPQLPALSEAVSQSLGPFAPVEQAAAADRPRLTMSLPAPQPAASGEPGFRRATFRPADYAADMDAWMVCGPFDLSGVTTARLSFRSWRSLALGLDSCAVAVSLDGSSFYGRTFSGTSDGWELYRFDLRDWPLLGDARRSRVWLAFAFQSHGIGSAEGAYVDDVLLTTAKGTLLHDGFESGMSGWRVFGSPTWGASRYRSFSGSYSASCMGGGPQIAAISPSEAPAGIEARVTITGSGFGERQGQGGVDFFYKNAEPTIRARVTKWSDRRIECLVPIAYVNRYPGSAASGPVIVTTADGARSAAKNFSVPYGWGRVWWPSGEARFYVAAESRFVKAARAAAEEWNAVGAGFRFVYAGKAKGGSVAHDYHNEVIWAAIEEPSVIAYACYYAYRGAVVEVDQVFNVQFEWGDGSNDTMDVQTICVHEMGHWLNLRDLYGQADKEKCMYGFGAEGWLKRSPTAGDRDGIRWVYAHAPLDKAAPTGTVTEATARFGENAVLRFRIDDPQPSCGWALVDISVEKPNGEVAYEVSEVTRPTNRWVAFSFRCRLPPGEYTWRISARDTALHEQTQAASARLTVQ